MFLSCAKLIIKNNIFKWLIFYTIKKHKYNIMLVIVIMNMKNSNNG